MERPEGRETLSADNGSAQGVQTGNACVVCWKSPTDRAHLIDRSLFPDPYHEPRRVVYLCRQHHDEYDAHTLDLLPYLETAHRAELAYAVQIFGLLGTLQRVTGMEWTGVPVTRAMRADIEEAGGRHA